MRAEQAERMSRHDNERLLLRQLLQVFFNQAILHPVLADLSRFAVGDKLIRIEGNVKIQIIIDHDLHGLAFDTLALVFFNGLAMELALGAEAVAVNSAMNSQFFCKFLRHLTVMLLGNISKRISDCGFAITLA